VIAVHHRRRVLEHLDAIINGCRDVEVSIIEVIGRLRGEESAVLEDLEGRSSGGPPFR